MYITCVSCVFVTLCILRAYCVYPVCIVCVSYVYVCTVYIVGILCISCVSCMYYILCAYCVYNVCIPCLYCVYPYSCIHPDSLVHSLWRQKTKWPISTRTETDAECEISTRNAGIPPSPSILATRVLTTGELCRTESDSRENSSAVFFKLREHTSQAAGQSRGASASLAPTGSWSRDPFAYTVCAPSTLPPSRLI